MATTTYSICLIGDVIIDVSLKNKKGDIKMRLGGIVHAARCMWALNIPFTIGYFAPSYIDDQINEYLSSLGCLEIIKLGTIYGSPYVFLIDDVQEVGNQGYEFLLRDEVKIEYDYEKLNYLSNHIFDDILVISGNYDLNEIGKYLYGDIHLDAANNISTISYFDDIKLKLKTLFISTSSDLFLSSFFSIEALIESFNGVVENLVLKENRGGSRMYNYLSKEMFNIPSQTRPIMHSVGVGDCYDATFMIHYRSSTIQAALTLAAWIAGEYASTTYPDDFKRAVTRIIKTDINELIKIPGVSLPWENRKNIHIYLAAPDFDYVDVSYIDKLDEALKYHNFTPRRPVKENGQMGVNASKSRRQQLYNNDMILLNHCSILVAVLLFDDPGTLIEIGLAAAMKKPTIVYDPFKIATNCMLTEVPDFLSHDIDEIISEIFIISSKLNLQ